MNFLKKSHWAMAIVLFAVIGIITDVYPGNSSAVEDTTQIQDVRILERRMSLIEQRLYSIELSINRLQQSGPSQRETISQSGVRDYEIKVIAGDVKLLEKRLSEIECGLVKLDERTSVGDPRKSTGAKPPSAGAKPTDPCRLYPDTPLRLSNRP
jgi:hypothetical protein